MAPRGRKRKSIKNKVPRVITPNNEAAFATSSPVNESSITTDEENMLLTYKQIENEIRNEFHTFLNSIDEEILNLPLEDVRTLILSELEDDICGGSHKEPKNKTNNTVEEFKHPLAVPKLQKNKNRVQNVLTAADYPSSSKSVHWELETCSDLSESDVFQTPKAKGTTSSNKSNNLNAHSSSHREPYAVVTPGPMMNRTVKMMRIPQAGETAVSLSGSPLLVTPFASNGGPQVTITIADQTGKVLAIQPDNFSTSDDDDDLGELLADEAKQKIKYIASYLSKLSKKI